MSWPALSRPSAVLRLVARGVMRNMVALLLLVMRQYLVFQISDPAIEPGHVAAVLVGLHIGLSRRAHRAIADIQGIVADAKRVVADPIGLVGAGLGLAGMAVGRVGRVLSILHRLLRGAAAQGHADRQRGDG